jgi:hypothetical protein
MVNKDVPREFEQKLAEYKQMVILRQEECVQIAKVLDEKGPQLSAKGKRYKNALLILGVVVATNATLELAMLKNDVPQIVMSTISILFLLVGAAVSMIAALDRNNRYEEKAGELRTLSSLCKSNDKRFMSDYKKFIDTRNPEIILAKLESLIDLQNDTLDNIRQRSDSLGVDLSEVNVSYRI